MAEHRQTIVDEIASNQCVYGGLAFNTMDQLNGVGTTNIGPLSFNNMYWARLNRTGGGDDAGGASWGSVEPHIYLDPRIGNPPWVVRTRSLVWIDHQADEADYFFGFGGWAPTVALRTELWGIGFKLSNTGTWFCHIQDDLLTHYSFDTGITGAAARELLVEIDGRDRSVRFYIDNVQYGADFVFSLPTVLSRISNNRAGDLGITPVGFQMWCDGTSGGAGRAYMNCQARDPIYEIQTGVPDGDVGPDKPVETLDLAGATFVDVSGSTYVPAVALPHYLTQWQITLSADTTFASPVQDIVTNTALEAVRHTGLTPSTGYIARVRYIDTGLGISEWSDAINTNTVATDPSTGWGACP